MLLGGDTGRHLPVEDQKRDMYGYKFVTKAILRSAMSRVLAACLARSACGLASKVAECILDSD